MMCLKSIKNKIIVPFLCCCSLSVFSQTQETIEPKSEFWKKVQFGGGLGLNFGNNFTNIFVAPSAIYNVNKYFAFGPSLQYNYINSKNLYTSHVYGASVIGIGSPIPEIQLSAEVEQLRISTTYNTGFTNNNSDTWNTALFLGGGYNTGGLTMGIRYNVLYNKNDSVYNQDWMPFVRVFF